MDGQGFYITLPSNSSIDVYPANKIWNYKTKLAKPIILNEPYEVGLIELQYPRNWHSFSMDDGWVSFTDHKDGRSVNYNLPTGHYDSITKIIKELNSIIAGDPITKRVTAMYNAIKNKIFFMGAEGMTVIFRGRLALILGFDPNESFEILQNQGVQYAPHYADLYGGRYEIYVYTNIVDYQLVGDSYVPLLRRINIADETRRIPNVCYDKPHYTPLANAVLDDIEISLKTDQNQYVPFTFGKVNVKLHFRPVRHNVRI